MFNKEFPSVIKYMGSKTEVLDLIEAGYNYLRKDYDYVCDLFAGSATLSGALRGKIRVVSNDIQTYSAVLTRAYLNNYDWDSYPSIEEISQAAEDRARRIFKKNADLYKRFSYDKNIELDEFKIMEDAERQLIKSNDWKTYGEYYLFTKNYSGTYWSYQQCVLIDSYRAVIDEYKNKPELYSLLLTCLMYAMAYNSQSTGHYAQYRIPENKKSMEDILIYRRKSITSFFKNKYIEFQKYASEPTIYDYTVSAVRDEECLKKLRPHGLVYADPPYCFVHYSRFYHILETLVKYDYPEVKYKGRYHTDRYQSEYCIKTEVVDAFTRMFSNIKKLKLDLLLSYSNSKTNTIEADDIIRLLKKIFNGSDELQDVNVKKKYEDFYNSPENVLELSLPTDNYQISLMKKPYNHSRMGRTVKKTIKVTELLFIVKKIDEK